MDQLDQYTKLTDQEKNLPEYILSEMLCYLYSNSFLLKNKNAEGVKLLPISLYPSPIYKNLFQKIEFYQIAFNKIIDKISKDQKFLEETLNPIAEKDDFIKKNLEISKKLVEYPHKQNIHLGIYRNDYMFDSLQNFIFLTEYNTIAASMGSFSDNLKKFYSHFSGKYPTYFEKFKDKEIPLEKADSIDKIAESLIEAIKLAFPDKEKEKDEYKNTIIVFVVQKDESNVFDQRAVEKELYFKHGVKSRRLTLSEIKKNCTQDENGNIILEEKKVSCFYFRAGYTENDYKEPESWEGRELIELSTAVKVPDINMFLTTFKVFQYFMSKPDLMMHYCANELILNDILRFFGGIYYVKDMEPEKIKELFSKIEAEPDKFILKPFKEGGGHNVSGEKLKEMLPKGEEEPSDLVKYAVIVEKISPLPHETAVIKDEKLNILDVVSEFSIYGIILTNNDKLIDNKSVGFLVRTKQKDMLEGGIMEGVGIIDLPLLVDAKVEPNLTHKVEVTAEQIQKYLDDLKAAEEAKKKAEEEEAKKKAEEEEAKKKAEEEEAKKKEEEDKKDEEKKDEDKKEEEKNE